MRVIERRAIEEFVGKFKEKARKGAFRDPITYKFIERDYTITESELDELLKEYEAGEIENVQTAAAEEEKGVVNNKPFIGKFKSVDALYRAYERLETEFTRRSQRLKALEAGAQRNTDENNLKIKIIIYRQGSIKPKSKNL